MEWFIAVVVIAALGVAAVATAGGLGAMAKDPVRDVYRQDLPPDRPLSAGDIQRLRFGIALRGYAMSQVDDVLDRLAREIADRDARIAELGGGAEPSGPELPGGTEPPGTAKTSQPPEPMDSAERDHSDQATTAGTARLGLGSEPGRTTAPGQEPAGPEPQPTHTVPAEQP